MENYLKIVEDAYSSSAPNDNYFKKYIKLRQISYYDLDDLINKEKYEDLICPICFYILKKPISCSGNKNSHSFCKECIDKYLKQSNKCPTCKLIFKYKINNILNNELNTLSFKCAFENKGCKNILSYSEYLIHINNCEYNYKLYECQVQKYNYNKKNF